MPTQKSLDNLKPHRFQKGNKAGKGNPLIGKLNKLRAALVKTVSQADIQAIAEKLVEEARDGDVGAARELFDRLFGKASQPIEVSGADGGPVAVSHGFDHEDFSRRFSDFVAGRIRPGGDASAPGNGN